MNERNDLNNNISNQNNNDINESMQPVDLTPTSSGNMEGSPDLVSESVQNVVEEPEVIDFSSGEDVTSNLETTNNNIVEPQSVIPEVIDPMQPQPVEVPVQPMMTEVPIESVQPMMTEAPVENSDTLSIEQLLEPNVNEGVMPSNEPQAPMPSLTPPPVEPTVIQPAETNNSPKKNKKGLFITLIIALILVVGVTGVFVMFTMKKKSDNAFLLSINTLKTEMFRIVEPVSSLPKDFMDKYSLDGKMNINIAYDEYSVEGELGELEKSIIKIINKIDFNYSSKVDIENKKVFYQFRPTIDNEDVLNLKFYNTDKSNYVFLGKLYDKYIQLEDSEFNVAEIIDYSTLQEDSNKIYDEVLDSLKKNLKDEYFTKENATIKIGNESKKVIKSTLVLDEKNTSELLASIIKSLETNEETKKIITKYIPDFFEEEIEIVENIEGGPVLYFSTYMNKLTGKQYQYEINFKDEYEDINITYILTEVKELIISSTEKYFEEEVNTYKFLINSDNKKTTIEMKDIDNKTIMTLNLTEEKVTYTQKGKVDDQDIEFNFTYESKEVKKNEEYQMLMNGLLKVSGNNKDLLTLNIKADHQLKKNTTINETVTNSIKISDMTEDDFNQILSELFNIYVNLME
ncbi:MAG: hypothetical protein PHD10_00625 [Bacilli bacterium]|nr:hypothetical protein [Bacilli bacterium]